MPMLWNIFLISKRSYLNKMSPHVFIAVLAQILFVCTATASITYTLNMSHAEHFCGIATGGWPTTGVGSPCSHTSPRWYQVYGLGLNPLNKRAYVVDVDGYTVTSVPIPDLSTGNVELVAGPLGCGSRAVCRGTTTGSFAGTRINYGQGILMSAQLLPKFYLAEYGNYRLLELDLS
eukprot:PhM_4_TR15239/c1_g3_i7/m.104997